MAKIEGNPKVNPSKMTCDGKPILGWVVEYVDRAGNILRRWMETFMPDPAKLPPGYRMEPLTYADDERLPKKASLPAKPAAPAAPPVPAPPPKPPAAPPVAAPPPPVAQVPAAPTKPCEPAISSTSSRDAAIALCMAEKALRRANIKIAMLMPLLQGGGPTCEKALASCTALHKLGYKEVMVDHILKVLNEQA